MPSLAGALDLVVVSLRARGTRPRALPQEEEGAAVARPRRAPTAKGESHKSRVASPRRRNAWWSIGGSVWYLGTERSPLMLLAGLQRRVTTALRPDSQDEVGSRDLGRNKTKKKHGKQGMKSVEKGFQL